MVRVPVPKKLRNLLLRKNASAYCVCKARDIGLNFHHIDGDSSNTVDANLAVLCVRDHDANLRPEEHRPRAAVNHLDSDRDTIASKKAEWEAFVAEAGRPKPAVLATLTAYGTEDSLHSANLHFSGQTCELTDASSSSACTTCWMHHPTNGSIGQRPKWAGSTVGSSSCSSINLFRSSTAPAASVA